MCLDHGQMTMMLHNYGSRQFHRNLNGGNSSGSIRDKHFSPMGRPIGGKWVNDTDFAHQQVWTVLSIFERRKSVHQFHRYFFSPMDMLIEIKWANDSCWPITGLENLIELRMEKIRPEICLLQSLKQTPTHPSEALRQYPSSWMGWGVKMIWEHGYLPDCWKNTSHAAHQTSPRISSNQDVDYVCCKTGNVRIHKNEERMNNSDDSVPNMHLHERTYYVGAQYT